MDWIIVILISFGLVVIGVSDWNYKFKKKLKLLSNSRTDYSKEEYISFYIEKGYMREHVELVYETINDFMGYKWFAIHPEDDLVYDYQIHLEDLEYCLDSILKKLNQKLPKQECINKLIEKYSNQPHTAEHLLELLDMRSQ